MQATAEPWDLIVKQPDFALASWKQVFTVIWRRETTMEGAESLRSECRQFAERHPRGIALLTIVESGAPLPSSGPRKAIAEFLGEASSFIKCSAVIFEGSGFRAAAVRSVVTGLTLMARQKYPHKVCDLDEGVRMFAGILPQATGVGINEAELKSTLAELRRRIDAT